MVANGTFTIKIWMIRGYPHWWKPPWLMNILCRYQNSSDSSLFCSGTTFMGNLGCWPVCLVLAPMTWMKFSRCLKVASVFVQDNVQNMLPPTRTFVHLPIMSPIMTPSIMGYKSTSPSEQYAERVIYNLTLSWDIDLPPPLKNVIC